MRNNAGIKLMIVLALLLYLALTGANILLGDLNQDEGWYLYAARQVAGGELPYRDFAFTQAPVMPFVYAPLYFVVRAWGVLGGRIITALLGLAGVIMGAVLAARCVEKQWRLPAALLGFIVIGINVYQSYFTSVVKTYSLCALFLTAGMLALTYRGKGSLVVSHFLAGVLLALAAGTRLSAGIALPIVFIYLVYRDRLRTWPSWFMFGAGGGLGLLAVFLPLFIISPSGFLFGVIEYHTLRSPGSLAYMLVLKAGFLSRAVQAYFVAVVLFCLVLAAWISRLKACAEKKPIADRPLPVALLFVVFAGISLVHFMAPFPYDDYQVIAYPVLGAALAAAVIGLTTCLIGTDQKKQRFLVTILLSVVLAASALASFSSPINQQWMIRGRDRIWWLTKDKPDILLLREAGQWIRENTDPDDVLLTQDTYLAVEADLDVPPGLELGPFSYYPDLETTRADELNVVNREMFETLIRSAEASVAAFSGYSLTIRSPEISELEADHQAQLRLLVEAAYQPAEQVDNFGQAHTTLQLLKARNEQQEIP